MQYKIRCRYDAYHSVWRVDTYVCVENDKIDYGDLLDNEYYIDAATVPDNFCQRYDEYIWTGRNVIWSEKLYKHRMVQE